LEYFFGGIMIIGLAYLILMILGLADNLDFIDLDGILGLEGGAFDGFGCALLATFCAFFGAFGLTGTLMNWNPLGTLITAVALGFALSRLALVGLRLVLRQQSAPVTSALTDLIGRTGQVTIASAPGKTGEVLIEADTVAKYPIREVNGESLQRGDRVAVLSVEGRFLQVRKLDSNRL
jgi:membrane-bound ClpP family serine protease